MTLRSRLIFLKQSSYLDLDISCLDLQRFPVSTAQSQISETTLKTLHSTILTTSVQFLHLHVFAPATPDCSLFPQSVLYFPLAMPLQPTTSPLSPAFKTLFTFFKVWFKPHVLPLSFRPHPSVAHAWYLPYMPYTEDLCYCIQVQFIAD